MNVIERTMPYDPQAELGVLGSLIILPSVFAEISPLVSESDFYDVAHSAIFAAMKSVLESKGRLDHVLLIDELRSAGKFESVGGSSYLMKVINACPNAAHAIYYSEIVAAKSLARRVIHEATGLLTAAYDERTEPGDLVASVSKLSSSVSVKSATAASTIGTYAGLVMDDLESTRSSGINRAFFGIESVDELLGPIMPAEMCIIAARMGMGKTSFAHGILRHSAMQGRPALMVSLEMRGEELATRELCRLTNVDSRDVRAGRIDDGDKAKMRQAQRSIGDDFPFWIWSPSSAKFSDIRAMVLRAVDKEKVTCVAIDYFTRINVSGGVGKESRRERFVELSGQLKSLAREADIPLFVLSQLNREGANTRPTKAMLSETDAIAADADAVLLIHGEEDSQDRMLIVDKFRGASTCDIPLRWIKRKTMFEDAPPPPQNETLRDWNN